MFTWMEDHTTPGGGGYFAEYGVEVDPTMDKRERRDIMAAIFAVGEKFANQRAKGESAGDAFTAVYDSITFKKTTDYDKGCVTESAYKVSCAKFSWDQPQSSVNNIVHELGHVLNNLKGGGAYDFGWSYADRDVRKAILRPRTNGVDWQQNDLYDPRDPLTTGGEMFGDMLVAWVFNAWNTDPRNNDAVEDALTDMNVNMAQWIN